MAAVLQAVEPILVTPHSVLGDDLNPPDREFWVYDEMCPLDKNDIPRPNFPVKVTAEVFFARTPDWIRWREKPDLPDYPDGYFVLNGEKLRDRRTETGNRVYTLADIERMAHALADTGAISGMELINIIMIVKWIARQYKVIE